MQRLDTSFLLKEADHRDSLAKDFFESLNALQKEQLSDLLWQRHFSTGLGGAFALLRQVQQWIIRKKP